MSNTVDNATLHQLGPTWAQNDKGQVTTKAVERTFRQAEAMVAADPASKPVVTETLEFLQDDFRLVMSKGAAHEFNNRIKDFANQSGNAVDNGILERLGRVWHFTPRGEVNAKTVARTFNAAQAIIAQKPSRKEAVREVLRFLGEDCALILTAEAKREFSRRIAAF